MPIITYHFVVPVGRSRAESPSGGDTESGDGREPGAIGREAPVNTSLVRMALLNAPV
jgi:hypothetical protein